MQIVKIDDIINNILKKEQKILKNKFGEIEKQPNALYINQNTMNIPYRGIDHYDIQYAMIAEYAKANQFLTFDGAIN